MDSNGRGSVALIAEWMAIPLWRWTTGDAPSRLG